jgi:membrane carboxypeptidase/penicillin-binding protein
MNPILIKMFATALALSQVTVNPDQIKTQFDPELDRPVVAQSLRDGCAQMRRAFDIEDIKLDDLIATAMDDPKAVTGGVKAFKGLNFNDLFLAYREFCKNETVEKSPVDLREVIAFYNRALADLPDDKKIRGMKPTGAYVVVDGKGQRYTEVFDSDQRRLWVPLSDIPEHVRKAFITAEDKRFQQHKGVDERGLIRAFIANLGAPGRPQGGSTITQQVAKNLLVGDDVTYERKIREMVVASRMESMLSKDDILELYLNAIYLGRGSWGIEMAARSYFGKPAKELTLAEGALLAGLTKGPNYFSPEKHPDRARGRLSYVLSRMQEDGALQADAVKEANARLPAVIANERVRRDTGFHFVDQVAREAKALNVDGLGVGASVVRTTIRPEVQRAAEFALQDGLARYEQMAGRARFQGGETNLTEAIAKLNAGPPMTKPAWQQALERVRLPLNDLHWTSAVVLGLGAAKKNDKERGLRVGLADGRTLPLTASTQQQRWLQLNDIVYVRVADRGKAGPRAELRVRPEVQGAAVVLDNKTGAILAVVGGFSYQKSQLNRATQSQRQPGSTLKPFTFLAALRSGLQPNTMVRDMPITLPPISGSQTHYSSSYIMADPHDRNYWTPKNYSGSGGGVTTLRRALEHSKNLVTANLLDRGIDQSPVQSLRKVCELTQEAQVYKDCVPYYPFVLGAQPARLVDLAAFYAAVAMEGARPAPHVIDAIEQNGATIYRHQKPPVWLGSGDRVSFYQLKSILQGVVARGTAASIARLSPYVAGKTGTSDDENDAWFIGFTNEVTIGVWVGYDNADGRRRTLGPGMTGGKVALPIFEPIVEAVWRDYARRTPLSAPSLAAGRQMAAIPIEYQSGEPLPPGTQGGFTEYLRLDAARQLVDTRYNVVSRDESYWARSYDPGADGDLYGPYASRSGGGYYYGGYDAQPGAYGPPGGSMFDQQRRGGGGLFGGLFGDQRYFEQREFNRQQQRRVDPDYFINRFQTN